MKKLNKTEAEILAKRMLKQQVAGAVEKAQNSPEIKSKVANATKLLKVWVKAQEKAKQEEHTFNKFLSDNRVLIEGGFGDIVLKCNEDWNSHHRGWDKNVIVDISSSEAVKEKLKEEILYQQIDSENLDELQGKVIEAIQRSKSQKLLA